MVKPTTSRRSIDGVAVADFDAALEHGEGAFYFTEDDDGNVTHVGIYLPDEPYAPRELPVNTVGGSPGWRWDGDREKPTLTPSIATSIGWGPESESTELWHGYLRAGRFESL